MSRRVTPHFLLALTGVGIAVALAGHAAPADPSPKAPRAASHGGGARAKGFPIAELARYKSPTGVAVSPDGNFVYVTCHTAGTLAVIDTRAGKVVREVPVGRGPIGVAANPDGRMVLVANSLDHTIGFVSTATQKMVAAVPVGYEPRGLAVSGDARWLYVANFLSDDVSVVDIAKKRQVARIPVGRAPSRLAVTPDGKTLVVNNFLSRQPATDPKLTSFVSLIDTATRRVVAEKRSPGTMLMGLGVTVSRDGRYAFALHHRPNFNITPSQLFQGWIQTNALSIIPLAAAAPPAAKAKPPKPGAPKPAPPPQQVVTVLLDNANSGAANPHGIAMSKDGSKLLITHRGIHRVSVLDLPALHRLIRTAKPAVLANAYTNMSFLWGAGGVIRRVDCGGKGPKGIAVSPRDGAIYVANYFSDHVAVLDPVTFRVRKRIALGGAGAWTQVRKGEFLFNDAVHCFQQWLSCTSCHPHVRADGVNWDLLNDGMTNPKNAKSLVGSWRTPPSMSLGVRARMEVAVEKGFLFIQFVTPAEGEVEAVSAYLRKVPFLPSPWHRKPDGSLDDRARRGKKLFETCGCSSCHPPPLYTDLRMYDVGTRSKRDFPKDKSFDTPGLQELYRTAPYLHDGRAATLEDVVTTLNKADRHGTTSKLTKAQIADLVAFLKAL